MNVKLLRKIAAVIQEKPKKFSMKAFSETKTCGTVHCIGGWACAISGLDRFGHTPAQKILGLSDEEAGRLFYPDSALCLNKFGGWNATPQQGAARIEHFIATKGRE